MNYILSNDSLPALSGNASWDTDTKMGIKNSIQDKIVKA